MSYSFPSFSSCSSFPAKLEWVPGGPIGSSVFFVVFPCADFCRLAAVVRLVFPVVRCAVDDCIYFMIISNLISDTVDIRLYDFDYQQALGIASAMDGVDLGISSQFSPVSCRYHRRFSQTPELLAKLELSLVPCVHGEWLLRRGVSPSEAFSLSYDFLSLQDLLDLYVIPSDHILASFGFRPIEGPVFVDRRNGVLVGICIRNVTTDLEYAASEKFTISNYGWFLFGFDLYGPEDEVFIVEGVFDAIMMRKNGFNAIALASAYPSGIQLACLLRKFKHLRLCLDNDFWGCVGAYIVGKCLGIPIFQTALKDAGCYIDEPIVLSEVSLPQLLDRLNVEVPLYNSMSDFTRPLPYNV